MRYTHFVFDIDNTLINTTGAVLHNRGTLGLKPAYSGSGHTGAGCI